MSSPSAPTALLEFLQCSKEPREQNDLGLQLLVLAETQFRRQLMGTMKSPHSEAAVVCSGVRDIKGQTVPILGDRQRERWPTWVPCL